MVRRSGRARRAERDARVTLRRILAAALLLAWALAPPRAARAGEPMTLVSAECVLSMPGPTRALQEVDHVASMASLVDFRVGPWRVTELVEGLKALLCVDRIGFDLLPASAARSQSFRLRVDFLEGFTAAESASPLLSLAAPAFDVAPGRDRFASRGTFAAEVLGIRDGGALRLAGRRLEATWRRAGKSYDIEPIDAAAARAALLRRAGGTPFFTLVAGRVRSLPEGARAELPAGFPAPGAFGLCASAHDRPASVEFLAACALDRAGASPAAAAWLDALSFGRAGRFSAELPADTDLLLCVPMPDFSVLARLPRGNALAYGLWMLGVDAERELAPLLAPRIGFALRREEGPMDFLTGESAPAAALLLEKLDTGEAAFELFRERIAAALPAAGTREARLAAGPFQGWSLPGTLGFDMELFCASTPGLFAIGHGFDFGREIASATGEARTLVSAGRGLVPSLSGFPLAFYADVERLGPLLEKRAAAAFGAFDRRTRDVARFTRAIRSLAGAAAVRDGELEMRLRVEGAAR